MLGTVEMLEHAISVMPLFFANLLYWHFIMKKRNRIILSENVLAVGHFLVIIFAVLRALDYFL